MLGELLKAPTENLGIFPVISMVIFLSVFVYAAWNMFRMDKEFCEDMSAMPLDNDNAVNRDLED